MSAASELTNRFPLISDQVTKREVTIILDQLETTLKANSKGEVVEFGCYEGTTSLFLRRLLDHYRSVAQLHVYDSFEGLPEKQQEDHSGVGEQFVGGALAVSKARFIRNFKKANLSLPRIHKGWFNELSDDAIPRVVAFAFLDGDYFESVMTPLELIEKRLAPGAIIVVDDYTNEALPGAARAVDRWCLRSGYRVQRIEQSLAIIAR